MFVCVTGGVSVGNRFVIMVLGPRVQIRMGIDCGEMGFLLSTCWKGGNRSITQRSLSADLFFNPRC